MQIPDHVYLKKKMRALRNECTGAELKAAILQHGNKCLMCGRTDGERYVFGPTKYVKSKLSFKVKIHIHMIKSDGTRYAMPICCGCHLSYHLFNRLDSDAMFGNKSLTQTVYKDK